MRLPAPAVRARLERGVVGLVLVLLIAVALVALAIFGPARASEHGAVVRA